MKKYNKYINELKFSLDNELMEMANITYKTTGIENVVIWLGPNSSYHGHRIKISNIPNSFKMSDCFVLTIPDFEIIGNINNKFIDNKILENIKKFVNLNLQTILDYSNYLISTEDLLDNLIKI